jgi:hypothetical protein
VLLPLFLKFEKANTRSFAPQKPVARTIRRRATEAILYGLIRFNSSLMQQKSDAVMKCKDKQLEGKRVEGKRAEGKQVEDEKAGTPLFPPRQGTVGSLLLTVL